MTTEATFSSFRIQLFVTAELSLMQEPLSNMILLKYSMNQVFIKQAVAVFHLYKVYDYYYFIIIIIINIIIIILIIYIYIYIYIYN